MEFRYHDATIRIDIPDSQALDREIRRRLRNGQGFALATLNLDHLVKLRRNAAFRRAYAAHDLIVADGNPVVWLSRAAGRPIGLVPGSDLVLPMARLAAEENAPVALFGSTAGALDRAAEAMQRVVPGLRIAARISPPMGFDPESANAGALLAELGATGARLTFLALGAPKQEILAARGRAELPGMGFLSIGAGLDFVAGSQTRAPALVRGLAMEWAWRAGSAPRRLVPRYAQCAAILPAELMAAIRLRRMS